MYIQITRQTHIGPTVVYVGQVIPVDEHVAKELIAYGKAVEIDRSPAAQPEAVPPAVESGTPEDAIALGETARARIGNDPQPDDPDKAGKPARSKKK